VWAIFAEQGVNPLASHSTLTVTATDPVATEGGRIKGVFTFTRTGSTVSTLTVYYIVTGTATPGRDYATLGASVTFPAGANSVTKTVTSLADWSHERNASVIVTLSPHSSYTVGSPGAARVVILNEDPFPRLR
jgi:hypothetical protein